MWYVWAVEEVVVSKSESPTNTGKLVARPTNIFKYINIKCIIYLREFQQICPINSDINGTAAYLKAFILEINLNTGISRQALSYILMKVELEIPIFGLMYTECNMKYQQFFCKKKGGLYDEAYYLMHVWINKDFKRSNCQGDVRSCSWNSQHVMKSLLSHIMGVYSFHQISIWNSHHCSIYGILKFPGTQLRIWIHTRKPKSRKVRIREKMANNYT